jgi:hypothetical protein
MRPHIHDYELLFISQAKTLTYTRTLCVAHNGTEGYDKDFSERPSTLFHFTQTCWWAADMWTSQCVPHMPVPVLLGNTSPGRHAFPHPLSDCSSRNHSLSLSRQNPILRLPFGHSPLLCSLSLAETLHGSLPPDPAVAAQARSATRHGPAPGGVVGGAHLKR